jgi:alkylated DNA repair dioxygenase AlkB
MNTRQLREDARVIENKIGWKAKRELIRSVQEMQGEEPCFQSNKVSCDRVDCGWRRECMPDVEQRTGRR